MTGVRIEDVKKCFITCLILGAAKLCCGDILEVLDHPILSASLPGDMVEEYTDPEVMYERFGDQVDFVIDGGIGGMKPSTVVDCTTSEWTVIRQGIGEWSE